MTTSNSITQSGILPIPVRESRALPQLRTSVDERQFQKLLRNDAEVAARLLNASQGTAAYRRLRAIRLGLERLRADALELQRIGRALEAEMFPGGKKRPEAGGTEKGFALSAQYRSQYRRMNQRHMLMNARLARYAFRPCVSYTVTADEWRLGLVPDSGPGFFETEIGPYTVTEGDAAMSLVRLDGHGDLSTVKLCEHCRRRWKYAKRPSWDRFCSSKCREAAYKQQPGFHKRKAEIQRNFRANEKRENARSLANVKKH
jgi:hypothetical protein